MTDLLYISPEPFIQGHASYTHVKEICEGLKKRGVNVRLLTPTYTVMPHLLLRILSLLALNFQAILSLKKILYCRWHFILFPIVLIAFCFRKKIIIEVNGKSEDLYISWKFTRYFKPFFEFLMIYQLKMASSLIVVTPQLETYCRKFVASKKEINLVANAANTVLFNSSAKNLPLPSELILPPKFGIMFGTFSKWQGIELLLNTAQHDDWDQSLHLLFVGDGIMRETIEAAALTTKHIHYLGRIDYSIVARIISRASVSFVLSENLNDRASAGLSPLKLFESMACGVPVIASNIPFQADLIKDAKAGCVLGAYTVKELRFTVQYLLDNPAIASNMGKNGEQSVHKWHSWDARAQATFIIINSLNSYLD